MTPDIPLHYRSIADVAAGIAAGDLSSEEVTRHTLERISSLEPKLHAFTEVRAGAPLGLQLIGPDLSEAALLAAGAGYEAASGFAGDHPAV